MCEALNGREEKKSIAMHSMEIEEGCGSIGEIIDLMRR